MHQRGLVLFASAIQPAGLWKTMLFGSKSTPGDKGMWGHFQRSWWMCWFKSRVLDLEDCCIQALQIDLESRQQAIPSSCHPRRNSLHPPRSLLTLAFSQQRLVHVFVPSTDTVQGIPNIKKNRKACCGHAKSQYFPKYVTWSKTILVFAVHIQTFF